MIINEMAGSGGDLMPYMFRYRKIGPLVGKRTWGGLVHTADTPGFIDGGSMIAPRGGFFTRDGKWAVENEGVGPDIDVENWPKDVIAGRDAQLERAVEEAMRLLKERPLDRMTKGTAAADVGHSAWWRAVTGQRAQGKRAEGKAKGTEEGKRQTSEVKTMKRFAALVGFSCQVLPRVAEGCSCARGLPPCQTVSLIALSSTQPFRPEPRRD